MAEWLGRTVATLGLLNLDAGPAPTSRRRPWVDLLPADRPRLIEALESSDLVIEAAHTDPARHFAGDLAVLGHRDINWLNIVVSPAGPVLLDFDQSGPARPWWELVHHAFLLACVDLGAEEPDPGTVRAAVRGYRSVAGAAGPADRTAFASLLTGLSDWVANNRHRTETLDQAERSLPTVLDRLDSWSELLA